MEMTTKELVRHSVNELIKKELAYLKGGEYDTGLFPLQTKDIVNRRGIKEKVCKKNIQTLQRFEKRVHEMDTATIERIFLLRAVEHSGLVTTMHPMEIDGEIRFYFDEEEPCHVSPFILAVQAAKEALAWVG